MKIEEIKNKAKGLRLVALTCVQEDDVFRLIYHFAGKEGVVDHEIQVPADNPTVDTITDAYPSAVNYEMEACEMYGIHFKGNPHAGERRFLPEELHSKHPMKKNAR